MNVSKKICPWFDITLLKKCLPYPQLFLWGQLISKLVILGKGENAKEVSSKLQKQRYIIFFICGKPFSMARIKFSSHENSGLSAYLSTLLNLSRPIPGRREKIKFNFCFHTSLQYLKRFYEDLKGLTLLIRPHYVIPKNQYSEMYFCF